MLLIQSRKKKKWRISADILNPYKDRTKNLEMRNLNKIKNSKSGFNNRLKTAE